MIHNFKYIVLHYLITSWKFHSSVEDNFFLFDFEALWDFFYFKVSWLHHIYLNFTKQILILMLVLNH